MHGGRRQGAGRKKGFAAKSAEEARKYLSERVAAEIGPIADVLLNSAKTGNTRAIKELFDRAWGRAPQAIQVDTGDKLPVPILVKFIDDEALEKYAFTDEEREVLEKRLLPKHIAKQP